MSTKPKVFLSYAREDRKAVLEIFEFLRQNGCDPWMDVEQLLAGQDWEREIETTIEKSDYFIVCLSTNAVDKVGYVQAELKQGLDILRRFPEGKIYLIPLRLDECKVPRSLSRIHYLDWFDSGASKKLLEVVKLGHRRAKDKPSPPIIETKTDIESPDIQTTMDIFSSEPVGRFSDNLSLVVSDVSSIRDKGEDFNLSLSDIKTSLENQLEQTRRRALDDGLDSVEQGALLEQAKRLQAALKRIDNGTYGICVICGTPIEIERLRAFPWATTCLHCSRDSR